MMMMSRERGTCGRLEDNTSREESGGRDRAHDDGTTLLDHEAHMACVEVRGITGSTRESEGERGEKVDARGRVGERQANKS